ncbi:MAG TPA: alanine racemase [Candidatus Saccharimonadales bacterium]|nr:alanine racemase [Candidatus Saccharimonadales bacterium]
MEEAGLPPLPRTAWLAIDLERLAGNLAALRGAVPAGVRIEPVVKADAYGHGSVPIARALAAAGADGLCVATFDEAVELRAAGLTLPLLVLYPIPPTLATDAARKRIAVSVGDEVLLARTLASLADDPPAEPLAEPLAVHLEIETGLGRGGVLPGRAAAAARAIAASPRAELIGAWSHLSEADGPARTTGQVDQFDRAAALLAAEGAPVRRWHLAASGGLFAASVRLYDSVRCGLSVYGVLPDGLPIASARASATAALRPVMSLRARPVRVVDLPAGSGVSYGARWVATRPSRIATLPIGYADGFSRIRSNRSEALVRGHRVPLVGSVAMDAVMADVTDVPGTRVSVDDEFVLLGEQGTERIDAVDLARIGTTISWEVLAGMARRLPRVYYAAAGPIGLRTLTEERGQWPTPYPDRADRGASAERPPTT